MMADNHEQPSTEPCHVQEEAPTIPASKHNPLLRQARLKRSWSQAELAERVEVNSETISRWENGVSTPRPLQLRKLCETFETTRETLGYPLEQVRTQKKEIPPLPPREQLPIRERTPPPPSQPFRKPKAMIGLVAALIILGTTSRLIPLLTSPSCGRAFSDAFHSQMDSRWHWISLGGKTTYRLTTAGLSLSTSTNRDLNPQFNFNAPRLLQSITGDFRIETQLEFDPDKNWQGAGLLLWQDHRTFMRFERAFGGGNNGLSFQTWEDGTLNTVIGLGDYPTTAKSVDLRIERHGDLFTASWHDSHQKDWLLIGETLLHFESLQVGIDLIADFHAHQITATYSSFTVTCL